MVIDCGDCSAGGAASGLPKVAAADFPVKNFPRVCRDTSANRFDVIRGPESMFDLPSFGHIH